MTNKTNIGYGYHSYPSERCAYCVNSCSPFQSCSGCTLQDNELGGCNHGCALIRSACEDSSTKLVNCLGTRLKNMVQLRRNQDNVQYGLNREIIYGTSHTTFH